ncbi:MAG: heparan-alpha-glucosaminide N-acetyltransferase [Candidatus Absconditabacterales bacterium]
MITLIKKTRITELDFLRGIALILMIYFHLIWSMKEMFGYDVSYAFGINFYIGKISAILFILISGIVYSFGRFNLKRFLLLAGIAIIISVATYFYSDATFIKFGIIHFFALSSLVALLFSKSNKYLSILIGIGIIVAGFRINTIHMNSDYLFFVGIVSKSFQSADFYPLIPWFGIYLIGMGLSKIFYTTKQNVFGKTLHFAPIDFVGRNTLIIYLIHQPIIIGILYVIKLLS